MMCIGNMVNFHLFLTILTMFFLKWVKHGFIKYFFILLNLSYRLPKHWPYGGSCVAVLRSSTPEIYSLLVHLYSGVPKLIDIVGFRQKSGFIIYLFSVSKYFCFYNEILPWRPQMCDQPLCDIKWNVVCNLMAILFLPEENDWYLKDVSKYIFLIHMLCIILIYVLL